MASFVLSDTDGNVNGVWKQTAGLLLGNPTVAHVSEIVQTSWHFPMYFTIAYSNITLLPHAVFFLGGCVLSMRMPSFVYII
jgi:hypothetical protein